jgi:hypothetical protein
MDFVLRSTNPVASLAKTEGDMKEKKKMRCLVLTILLAVALIGSPKIGVNAANADSRAGTLTRLN